jgi:anti-anti-sigma regulatory factor
MSSTSFVGRSIPPDPSRETAGLHRFEPPRAGYATAVRRFGRGSGGEAFEMRAPMLRIERVSPGRLRVTGELDRSNASVLGEAVRIVAGGISPGDPVEVDCSGVAFLDAAGSRTLLDAARALAPTHRLLVRQPGALVGRLLQLLARTEPSLVVVSEDVHLRRAS